MEHKTKTFDNTYSMVAEIAGWYGTFIILLAYGLVSFSLITGDSLIYQLMNITGSIGLLLIALVKKVYQSVTINIIWAVIGLVALVKLFI